MKEFLCITKALADENRLRIIMLIRDREPCVCQIVEVLGLAPSTTSKHLSVLKQAGLVDCVKRGRWIYYHLPTKTKPLVAQALKLVISSLEDSEVTVKDREKVLCVCQEDPGELARNQRDR